MRLSCDPGKAHGELASRRVRRTADFCVTERTIAWHRKRHRARGYLRRNFIFVQIAPAVRRVVSGVISTAPVSISSRNMEVHNVVHAISMIYVDTRASCCCPAYTGAVSARVDNTRR